jgi:hypothetical protein
MTVPALLAIVARGLSNQRPENNKNLPKRPWQRQYTKKFSAVSLSVCG